MAFQIHEEQHWRFIEILQKCNLKHLENQSQHLKHLENQSQHLKHLENQSQLYIYGHHTIKSRRQ